MQSFTLRPADWEDLPAFKHIVCTTLTEDIPALFDPNKLLEDKKIGFEYIMAAEQNGEVVGFCCRYACRDADTPYCAEIFSLCVLPKAQHSGIGRAFVEDALAILYISGFKICKVWLPAGNRRAREFFEAAALRATAHLASCSAAKSRIFFTVTSTPSRARTKNITDSKKRSRVFNTPAALLCGFHLPADFLQTRRKPPRKNGQNATIQYTALGVYYPCMPMTIQRGNVSSRAEYYVFRKFSVRERKKK